MAREMYAAVVEFTEGRSRLSFLFYLSDVYVRAHRWLYMCVCIFTYVRAGARIHG